jgi:Flp pilus assembly protein protease CpaA
MHHRGTSKMQPIQIIIGSVLTIIIGLVLFYASVEDLRHRTIRSIWVITLYILVSAFSIITGSISTQSTFVFLFTFILFMGIAVFSFGRFGIGDAMVLGALGWFYHDFISLQGFLYAMGAVCIPWTVFCILYYGRHQGFLNAIKGFKRHITIDEARPGMVLAGDNFMHGLTQVQIDEMRHAGYVTIDVKQPFPFIPVIFIAFMVTMFV